MKALATPPTTNEQFDTNASQKKNISIVNNDEENLPCDNCA